MTPEEFLTERIRIHDAASNGTWRVGTEGSEGSRVHADNGDRRMDSRAIIVCNGRTQPEDGNNATAIVDAHNTQPMLVAAVEAALKFHERRDDDTCSECFDSVMGDPIHSDWPCPAVSAITAALGGEDNADKSGTAGAAADAQ